MLAYVTIDCGEVKNFHFPGNVPEGLEVGQTKEVALEMVKKAEWNVSTVHGSTRAIHTIYLLPTIPAIMKRSAAKTKPLGQQ
jgi:hypothetical protein